MAILIPETVKLKTKNIIEIIRIISWQRVSSSGTHTSPKGKCTKYNLKIHETLIYQNNTSTTIIGNFNRSLKGITEKGQKILKISKTLVINLTWHLYIKQLQNPHFFFSSPGAFTKIGHRLDHKQNSNFNRLKLCMYILWPWLN